MDRDTLRRGIAAEVEVGDADWDEDGSWGRGLAVGQLVMGIGTRMGICEDFRAQVPGFRA